MPPHAPSRAALTPSRLDLPAAQGVAAAVERDAAALLYYLPTDEGERAPLDSKEGKWIGPWCDGV